MDSQNDSSNFPSYSVEILAAILYALALVAGGVFDFLLPLNFLLYFVAVTVLFVYVVVDNFETINENVEAPIQIFGKYLTTWKSGPHFLIPKVTKIAQTLFVKDQRIDVDMVHDKDDEDVIDPNDAETFSMRIAIAEFKRDSARVIWHIYFSINRSYTATFKIKELRRSMVTLINQHVRAILAQLYINDALESADGIGRMVLAHLLKSDDKLKELTKPDNESEENWAVLIARATKCRDSLRVPMYIRSAGQVEVPANGNNGIKERPPYRLLLFRTDPEYDTSQFPSEFFILHKWGVTFEQGGVVVSDIILHETTVLARRNVNIAKHGAEAAEHTGRGEGKQIGAFMEETNMSGTEVAQISVSRETVKKLPNLTPVIISRGGQGGLDVETLAAVSGAVFPKVSNAAKRNDSTSDTSEKE